MMDKFEAVFDKATIGHNSYTGTNYDFRDNVNKRIKRMVSKIICSLKQRERESLAILCSYMIVLT